MTVRIIRFIFIITFWITLITSSYFWGKGVLPSCDNNFRLWGKFVGQAMPDKILIPQQKRPFWGFKIRMRWDSCLARSRLTAIPHFAFWALPNRKTAPASARSRNPQDRGFDPSRSKIKQGTPMVFPILLGWGGIRTHGTLVTYDGFQDRSDQPLWHSSKICDFSSLPTFYSKKNHL